MESLLHVCSGALPHRPAFLLLRLSWTLSGQAHLVLCKAQAIQDERALPGQKVLWLLVSDSERIRHAAAQRYPNLVLTNLKR